MIKNTALLFALFIVILCFSFQYIAEKEFRQKKYVLIQKENSLLHETASIINNEIHQVDSDLFFLKYMMEHTVSNHKNPLEASDALLSFAMAKSKYDQVRYLDSSGNEIIRVNNQNGHVYAVDKSKLQNKGDRYYFKDTYALGNNGIFVSPLDLNVENGSIEVPHKPMVRFGTPVFDKNGKKVGVVILNYYGKRILDMLKVYYDATYVKNHDFELLNRDGYWLISNDASRTFGFMLPHGKSFKKDHPKEWGVINSSLSGQYESNNTVYTYSTLFYVKKRYITPTGSSRQSGEQVTNTKQYWKLVNIIRPKVFTALRGEIARSQYNLFAILSVLAFLVALTIAYLKKQRDSYLAKLREKTAEAEQASKFKSDFLANMSHEIRTPMNGIIGLSYLARKHNSDPKLEDYLAKIDKSANLLMGIINDILDFSKIEAGMLKVENIKFDMEEVLENVASLIALKTGEKNIELIFSTSPGVPRYLTGDPLRLGQVLINICNNAVKFTSEGEIVLSVDVVKKADDNITLRLTVKDTGIGMKPEQMKKIFVAFDQADTSVTRQYGGTGLGLSICRDLCGLMGGEIGVESEYGKGSTFWFTVKLGIPVKDEKSIMLLSKNFQNKCALVVDDNPVAREVFSSYLDVIGFRVIFAEDGKQAVHIVESAKGDDFPEIILMDWNMPVMDGLTASHTIKNSPLVPVKPKIILATAYGREDLIYEVNKSSIDGFLIKPITLSSLVDVILQVYSLDNIQTDNLSEHQKFNDYKTLWGAKLLLAEDSEINQQIAVELLNDQKIDVDIANNGQEAVSKVQRREYDGILMDLQMPVMDGYAATKQIRQLGGRYATLPIIAMTANTMVGDKEKAIAAGMNDHISKPINVDEMFVTLTKYIFPPKKWDSPDEDQTEIYDKGVMSVEVDGIDVKDGLGRVRGKKDLFIKLLGMFVETEQGFVAEFEKALERDTIEAGKIAHRLKGVAANISAAELSASAAVLEERCLSGKDVSKNDIEDIKDKLNTVLAAIAVLRRAGVAVEAPDNGGGAPDGYDALIDAVTHNDADALGMAREMISVSEGRYKKILEEAYGLLDVFDFQSALELLKKSREAR